jgi:hypothetical protein
VGDTVLHNAKLLGREGVTEVAMASHINRHGELTHEILEPLQMQAYGSLHWTVTLRYGDGTVEFPDPDTP